MFEQTFAQVGEISIRIAVGSHALIHLKNMHARPGNIFARQRAQHDPGCVATAHRESKTAARGNRGTGLGGDRRSALRATESASSRTSSFMIFSNMRGALPR